MNITTGIAPDGWERHVMQAGYTPMVCGVCGRTIWIGHGRTLEACDSVKALERHALYGRFPLVYDERDLAVLVDIGLPSECGLDSERLWFTKHMHTDVIAATTTDPSEVAVGRVLDPVMLDRPVHYEQCAWCHTSVMWDDAHAVAYDAVPLLGRDVQSGMRVAELCKKFARSTYWLRYLDTDHSRVKRGGLYYRTHVHGEV